MASQEEPKLYRDLDRRGRLIRGALYAFTLYHVLAMLVGGGTRDIKRPFEYVFGFYDQALRMTNSWGMFGKPPGATHVSVVGVRPDGSTVLLSTTNAKDRTPAERVRDVRIRKIQGKLVEFNDRSRFGMHYLDWFCRVYEARGDELVSVRAINHHHELRDDSGKIKRTPKEFVLLTRRCGSPDMSLRGQPVRPAEPRSRDDEEAL